MTTALKGRDSDDGVLEIGPGYFATDDGAVRQLTVNEHAIDQGTTVELSIFNDFLRQFLVPVNNRRLHDSWLLAPRTCVMNCENGDGGA